MRGFLYPQFVPARRAAMVGRDVPIAPPTRNEDKPDPCEVKQKTRARKRKASKQMKSVKYSIHSCEQCHSRFYVDTGHSSLFDESTPPDLPKGTYCNSRFCSKSCADAWVEDNPGKSPLTGGQRLALGCITGLFRIVWNKYVVTTLTVGLSWIVWKVLNTLYTGKPKK